MTLVLAAGALAAPAPARSQELDLSQPITYFVAEGSARSGFRQGDRALAEWAVQAWAGQAGPAVVVKSAPEGSASIRIYWVSADEGLFGETRARMVGGRFVADVFVHPDTDDLGSDIAPSARKDPLFRDTIVYLTCVHELGHAFGLGHTRAFADIMYSFQFGGDFVAYFMRFRNQMEKRDDIPRASPFSAADRNTFRDLVEESRR